MRLKLALACTLAGAIVLPAISAGQEWPVFKSDQSEVQAPVKPKSVVRHKARNPAKPAPVATIAAKEQARVSTHRLAIQVAENNPQVMNLALNNARNVVEYYGAKGETVAVEIVAFGPGLHMLREDTSPVKQRIAATALENPTISFAACSNTRANMSKKENAEVTLIKEAKLTPSGAVRLIELQESGYHYIRP